MIEVTKLESGLTIIKNKTNDKYATGMGIYVKAGSMDENDKEKGISHFLEHMHFKGTNKHTPKDLAFLMDSLGGYYNAFTSKEITSYHTKVLSENAPKAAELLLDIFTNSNFDPEEMELEKGVVIQEMKMIEDNHDEFIFEKIEESIYKGSPYESSIIGTESSVQNLTNEMLFDYKNRRYVQDNIVVVITCGQDDHGLPKIFEDGLAKLNPTGDKRIFKKAMNNPRYFNEVRDVEQTHLFLGMPSLASSDDDVDARKLATTVLGGGMYSRLYQNIREEKGLAYIIYASDYLLSRDGINYICSGLQHSNLEDAIKAIKFELEVLKDKGITENEFLLAKEKAKTGIVFSYEKMMSTTHGIASSYMLLDRIETLEDRLAKIDAITLEEVNKQAAMIGTTENYSVGVVSKEPVDVERIYNN
ncbi:MAG: M16 family metallopeptidase [Eubacteriales bacterium]